MATNHPMEFTDNANQFAQQFAGVLLVAALTIFAVLAFLTAARPDPSVAEPSWKHHVRIACRSPICLSPAQIVTAEQAGWMKRQLGGRVLIVDIGTRTERASTIAAAPADAFIPAMEAVKPSASNPIAETPGMAFRVEFGNQVDDALRAAGLEHDQPVVLMSPSMERSVLAALLLQERGYSRILVIND